MKIKLLELLKNSYSNFSNIKVAAIAIGQKQWKGVNIETINLSSICAERSAIFSAISNGETGIKEIHLISSIPIIYPCGACCQVISEFIVDDGKIFIYNLENNNVKVMTINELLPYQIKGLI